MKKPWTDRFGDFMAGKGFYIVLFLCVAAIGISGYYLFSSLAGDGDTAVSGPAQVVVTPKPSPTVTPSQDVTPAKPSVTPTKPSPSPSPSASTAPSVPTSPAPSTKPTVATAPTVYTWPVKGQILDAYSPDKQRKDVTMGDWRTHAGIDIAAEEGTQVKAAAAGVVESIKTDDLLGTTLTIDHSGGIKSVYGNLGELPTVSEGDSVSAGDIIGSVGATAKGESKQAAHLHLAFLKNDSSADPLKYLPEQQ